MLWYTYSSDRVLKFVIIRNVWKDPHDFSIQRFNLNYLGHSVCHSVRRHHTAHAFNQKGMDIDVDKYVNMCEICQRIKHRNHAPFGIY